MSDESNIHLKHVSENLYKLFRTTGKVIIAVLTLLVYILIVTINTPVYIFRIIVINIVAPWLRPDLGPCMNGLSSYLATDMYSGKPSRCTTIILLTLNGSLSKSEFTDLVKKNWIEAVEVEGQLKYPQFTCVVQYWLGFPFWRPDPNFDVKNHVLSYSEQKGGRTGDEMVTEQELDTFVESLLNNQFSPDKSPWELHIVENYHNDELLSADSNSETMKSVIALRLHHSMADGFSLLDAIVGGLAEIDVNELNVPKFRYPKLTPWQKLVYCLTTPVVGVKEFARLLSRFFSKCPWKVPDSKKHWHHRYAKTKLISVEQVKLIKKTLGVSFTSVLLSTVSSGIYRILEMKRKRGTLLVEKEDDHMLCMSALPLPETRTSRKMRLKNHTTAYIFDIPASHFPSSLERLKRCDENLEACKNSVVPIITTLYTNSVGWMMGSLPNIIGKNRMISTGLTNFPTKPNGDKFGAIAGKEILFAEFASGELVGDAGVGFMVVSFYPYIRMAVTAESAVLSREEIDHLIKYIEEEFKVLYSIAETIKPDMSRN